MIPKIADYDVRNFNTEMHYRTVDMWGFQIMFPKGSGITPREIRWAITQKFNGMTDHAIQIMHGDILKLEWVIDPNKNGAGQWEICNVKKSPIS